MEDSSSKRRLIGVATEDHACNEVRELSEETKQIKYNQSEQMQQQQQEKQRENTVNSKAIHHQTGIECEANEKNINVPQVLQNQKEKSIKNSNSNSNSNSKSKSKSKSKIPRSPSLANSSFNISGNSGNCNTNTITTSNNNNTTGSNPPQTPPLPLNYLINPKFMNGSGLDKKLTKNATKATPTKNTALLSPTIDLRNKQTLTSIPTTPTPTPAPATAIATATATTNIHSANNANNNIMGGGVQLNNTNNNNNSNNNNNNNNNNVGANGINNASSAAAHRSGSINITVSRRPQIQFSPIAESPKHFQYLTLTVRKDENGYGMKVSGDNPVFVESVKPGGAAQVAGLIAGDMILKVNGQEVRSEKHPTVVNLIKASTIVELAVKRSHKLIRPSSVGIVPTTPILSGRDRTASITGPQPVDSIKRREMETYKIQTLQKMLEQEKLNLERLKGDTNNPSYKLSEANIRKLKEQLRQVGVEDAPAIKYQATSNNKNTAMLSPNPIHNLSVSSSSSTSASTSHHFTPTHPHSQQQHHFHPQVTTPQPQSHSTPAFLSLLPRSLSSLSLGTRKNKIDKDLISTPLNNTTDFLHNNSHNTSASALTSSTSPFSMSQSLHQAQHPYRNSAQQMLFQQHQAQQQRLRETPKSSNVKSKHKFAAQVENLLPEDIPPPLPQRNLPRPSHSTEGSSSNNNNLSINNGSFSLVSDLDNSIVVNSQQQLQRNSPQPQVPPGQASSAASASKAANLASQKKRSKAKTKALSDPKMSTQMFLEMETADMNAMDASGIGNSDVDSTPPPLPPRQPGMLEEAHKNSFQNITTTPTGRPPPNSIDTLLNYPLVATCTPVHRDNMAAAFPLSQRPNIVQQLQQHQQQQQQQQQHHHHQQQQQQLHESTIGSFNQSSVFHNHDNKHRRTVSSPENMHPKHPNRLNKSTSGSWELTEKDGEGTPPGTPPPPYLTTHNNSGSIIENPHDRLASPSGILVESHQFTPLPEDTATALINRIPGAQLQKEIISMEDEDTSDQEGPFIDENGPFNYLQRLLEAENVAFLAVFLNYVLSNSEPAPLLFYLITGLYKEGTAKDMRKWAYEIHSTFLVPRAPLSWYRQDESLAREVDNVLQSEFDKVEILRKVFWKSRKRARDIICEQLREFQQKRTAGLGTIYGPTDAQLAEAKGDKQREQYIFEETLLRKLQILIDEYEKDLPIEDPKKLALCSALSTVIHRIFITRSHPNNIVDRVHHFVSREKSFKSRLMGKNRKMVVRGHPLVLRQYYEVTHCNHCQTIIWGVSPQGYHCTDCKLNIHRPCSKVLDENCPGPLPQAKRKDKDPHNDNKISKFMEKIRPRTSSDFIALEKRARIEEDLDSTEISNERISSSIVRQPSDRRPDKSNISLRASSNGTHSSGDLQSSLHANSSTATSAGNQGSEGGSIADAAAVLGGAANSVTANAGVAGGATGASGGGGGPVTIAELNAQDAIECSKDVRREILQQQHQQNKSAPVSVNRSESYKERLSNKRSRNSRRKTSDPSLTSRQNDDQTDVGLFNSNYTASSNSSLSSGGGSESPSTSMEQVGGSAVTAAATVANKQHHHHAHSAPHHSHQHSHQDSFHGSIGGGSSNASFWSSSIGGSSGPTIGQLTRQWNFDSDDEDDLNEVDWSSNVAAEMLAALTDAEKKRQEIINEIYQTERSHVRTLKLLDRLFFCPLHESGVLSNDHLNLLFPPALISLRELHGTFEQQLKQRRIEHNHIVSHVGDLLVSMFEGKSGEELREFAAQFCARQQIALEALKEKRRKDEQLQKLLSKAESHKACRRLQLKDLLPTVLQRLTKYPLLFENLYKVTVRVIPENVSEAEAIQRALESSKKILVDVNQAVKTAEDAHKLQNIQRKLDKSTFDKEEFKNLDLTQYRLIHDGSLTMKKNPSIQLHGLLFENMIVLLTKQDDKYALKYLHAARNTEVNNKPVSPIMSIDSETLVRQEAADKNSFFLIKTKTSQMLELRAPSSSECKTWFKHISDAAEQYKPRSKNANQEPVDDPAIATLPHSNTKESLELTPERPPPMAATATVTTTPLAPMMPPPMATTTVYHNNNGHDISSNVQLRNDRREGTPVGGATADNGVKMRSTPNELLPSSVNRTMSTRSCGEAQNTYSNDSVAVTLRHTQSARKANDSAAVAAAAAGDIPSSGGADEGNVVASKRDSASIVYSNNSNNTRTFIQNYLPLVDPTAIRISISPAHTAEPVLTSGEKLRRLDASIRNGLLEKQKIICDMFRLPVEHFNEIVDIAAMPEAPKDSADIALAAYAQVQSLTEVLNEYMQVSAEQEVSAVSTTVCDQCHEKQRQLSASSSTSGMTQISTNSNIKQSQVRSDSPPPLPPPNRQLAQPQAPTPTKTPLADSSKLLHPVTLGETSIHEDDDGYCEIDELRLPAITTSAYKPPAPEPSTSISQPVVPAAVATTTPTSGGPELVKRQSTLSSDSIPEETTGELIAAIKEDHCETEEADRVNQDSDEIHLDKNDDNDDDKVQDAKNDENDEAKATTKSLDEVAVTVKEDETVDSAANPNCDEHIEINEDYDSTEPILEKSNVVGKVDSATQTAPVKLNIGANYANVSGLIGNCGPNRIQHANSLEPSIPCYALSSIVSALNAQISLLLPKINDRDMERERLRKENQHLRELLNAMHERQRVEAKLETPNDVKKNTNATDGSMESANGKSATTVDTTAETALLEKKVVPEDEN